MDKSKLWPKLGPMRYWTPETGWTLEPPKAARYAYPERDLVVTKVDQRSRTTAVEAAMRKKSKKGKGKQC